MTINSEPGIVNASDVDVFSFLTDFNNFQKLIPEQIINWQSNENSCSFTIKGMADLKMQIQEKTPHSKILISSEANLPLAFDLSWEINLLEGEKSQVQLVFEGKINPMISMMVKSPLQNFINVLVQKLKEHFA
ncbi:MAG: hypothetical protein K8S00_08540 [Bacteroidales bacterium]|nr:hypothetical protein [Bacteroidales bacterium]